MNTRKLRQAARRAKPLNAIAAMQGGKIQTASVIDNGDKFKGTRQGTRVLVTKAWKPRKVRSIRVTSKLQYQGLSDSGKAIFA